jgi:hypothetical protein
MISVKVLAFLKRRSRGLEESLQWAVTVVVSTPAHHSGHGDLQYASIWHFSRPYLMRNFNGILHVSKSGRMRICQSQFM